MEYIITQMDDISAIKDISASAFDYPVDMNDLDDIVSETPTTNLFPNSRSITPKSFECSHRLDNNSLKALQYDDEEDQVQQITSRFGKQKAKGDSPKSFKPGEPCVVCGDAASGIHYSVWACNGCKTFFRRVVIENKTYSCKRNGNCRINKSMRCACRHCRFRKCLKVGMDCTELNIERRRKKHIAENATSPSTNIKTVDDPIIRELLVKEHQFVKLLTSTLTPIHATIDEALRNNCIFDDFAAYTQSQMLQGDQMNFSYWRAKILSTMIEWAKSFPEFMALSTKDQEALVVHTSFSNMVLSEAFHTPERYTDRIVFPDGLSGFRNVSTNILKERSGLIPTVAAVINSILVPIRKLKMTEIEYVLLQAIILFDPESISLSKSAVARITEKRDTLIESMRRYTQSYSDNDIQCGFRLAELLLRVSNVQKVAAFKRETLSTIETFNLMSPHTLTMEISKKYPDTSFF